MMSAMTFAVFSIGTMLVENGMAAGVSNDLRSLRMKTTSTIQRVNGGLLTRRVVSYRNWLDYEMTSQID